MLIEQAQNALLFRAQAAGGRVIMTGKISHVVLEDTLPPILTHINKVIIIVDPAAPDDTGARAVAIMKHNSSDSFFYYNFKLHVNKVIEGRLKFRRLLSCFLDNTSSLLGISYGCRFVLNLFISCLLFQGVNFIPSLSFAASG